MNKKIILLSTLVVLGSLVLCQAVYAANASLSVVPTTADKSVATAFNVSVNLDAQGNKVCVVKGTLNFNNLTCKGITVASGLMAQITPSCSNPSFTLGIPKCTTTAQNILTVSVKGNAVEAVASLAGAKVIGVGVVIASNLNGGKYNIISSSQQVATSTPVVESTSTSTPTSIPTASINPETTPVNVTTDNNVGVAGLLSVAKPYFWPLLILFIIIISGYVIYWFVIARKGKKKEQK